MRAAAVAPGPARAQGGGADAGAASRASNASVRASVRPEVPDAPLHLLLARNRLSEAQAETAARLAHAVTDWPGFVATARRKFSLPFAFRHLSALGFEAHAPEAMACMRAQARAVAMQSLQMSAAQKAFHQRCIAPLEAEHLYLKGPCLAVAYHDDLGLRVCRDIDVLVSPHAFEPVLHRAIAEGYRPILDQRTGRPVETSRDLRALLRYKPKETPLRSPEGPIVELHRWADVRAEVFPTEEIIAAGREVAINGVAYRAMPAPLLLVYLCHHNTRHLWSHLHWVADLDAVLAHPECDLAEARRIAAAKGLGATLEACLGFHKLAAEPEAWAGISHGDRGGQLLDACVASLPGDLEHERALAQELHGPGGGLRWADPTPRGSRVWKRFGPARLAPALEHYVAWPLPDRLQWLYVPWRVATAVGARLSGLVGWVSRRSGSHWK